ncbi:MAG: DnaA/Hda family protein [Rickettsiaceae bacterium]|nr:DnaA/Hda family protein [Rickettsiaceae bacterium]
MKQTAFFLSGSDAYDLNEYMVSSSNNEAYSTLNNWPNGWGVRPYEKTLIIQGEKSSGKTFLAKKWAKQSGALFIKKTHELTESILEHHNAFIIEDFDGSWSEEKLLHHFNIIHESGKYLLITTTRIPDIKLPDLASRIKSCNKVSIGMPDDDLMKMLIFKLFSNYSIRVPNEVIEYLVKVLPREFPEIITSVNQLNMFALEHKRKITIPLIKQVLSV